MTFRKLLHGLVCTAALLMGHAANAQDPVPIKILVGFAPGGLTDIVARLFADRLRTELNQPVVVENKVGASGRLATQALKASPPDGRTLMVVPNSGPIFLILTGARRWATTCSRTWCPWAHSAPIPLHWSSSAAWG